MAALPLMLEDKSIVEVLEVKKQIEAIAGVERVVWLDDIADLKQPVEMIGEEVRSNYLAGDDALLQIVFTENDYAKETHEAIGEIKALLGEDTLISGSAVDAFTNVKSISGYIVPAILIALAIILVILLLTTDSIFEVVLFLFTIGVAIVINMGTNIIFGEISYMTYASVAILQLATSMDYSIFLLHRFSYERQTESDPRKSNGSGRQGFVFFDHVKRGDHRRRFYCTRVYELYNRTGYGHCACKRHRVQPAFRTAAAACIVCAVCQGHR